MGGYITNPFIHFGPIASMSSYIANPFTPVEPDKIRIVCMSDTHSETGNIKFAIPYGDVFVHAGDFTRVGTPIEIYQFNQWLGRVSNSKGTLRVGQTLYTTMRVGSASRCTFAVSQALGTLPHRYKIVIAGNHELSLDRTSNVFGFINNEDNTKHLTNCIYLQDSEVTLFGIKFYGSPWQPKYRDWAFNLSRGEEILSKWNLIPDDTDILITHGPPLGHGDLLHSGRNVGCADLLSTVQLRVKPKYHIFGHIHEGYGVTSDSTTVFINAATCNRHYMPVNLPVVFDIPLPEGHSKF